MQTFVDIISIAKEKYLDELFDKKTVLKKIKKAEMGSDEEQPIRENLYEWNGP